MIPLSQYVKVKNRYCICYFGPNEDFVKQLILERPKVEQKFSGLKIYIACRDDMLYLAEQEPRMIPKSKIIEWKNQFGYIREIKWDLISNPVEKMLLESEIGKNIQIK